MHELFHDFFEDPSPMNATCRTFVTGESVCLPPVQIPFYFAVRQNLLDFISDDYLALAAPVIAYWIMSLFFHCLDISGWRWLDKYRIHESEEVKSRNLVTPREVVWAVVIQHVMQTALGLLWLGEPPEISITRCQNEMQALGGTLLSVVRHVMGEETGLKYLELWGPETTHWLYWWGIPAARVLFALYVLSAVCHDSPDVFQVFR
jgi:sphinganine C4-monooxygenase